MRARYYNPVIARFTQEDEYRGDGLNLYAYCANNPVVYYDPSGYLAEGSKDALAGKGNAGWKEPKLLDELANSGAKYNPEDIVAITKTADGKLVWMEHGNANAGLEHIMNHADQFVAKGIEKKEIKDLVMTALEKGKIVDYQGKGKGRPIYEVVFNGKKQHIAITVGSNGFIVGANPKSLF